MKAKLLRNDNIRKAYEWYLARKRKRLCRKICKYQRKVSRTMYYETTIEHLNRILGGK